MQRKRARLGDLPIRRVEVRDAQVDQLRARLDRLAHDRFGLEQLLPEVLVFGARPGEQECDLRALRGGWRRGGQRVDQLAWCLADGADTQSLLRSAAVGRGAVSRDVVRVTQRRTMRLYDRLEAFGGLRR